MLHVVSDVPVKSLEAFSPQYQSLDQSKMEFVAEDGSKSSSMA